MQPSETSKIRMYVWPWVKTGAGLDVGCGADKVHPECTGMDAGNFPNVTKGSAEKLTFDDDSFDWVYSAHCLEHLDHPDKAIAEMTRVLKPDGTLILYLPYKDWYDKVYPGGAPWHKHQFRPSDIRGMVEKHWPGMWVVTEELRGGPRKNDEQEYGFLLILQREEPKHAKRFYVSNWPNIGDTASLDALFRVLHDKYPGCEINLRYDNSKLFTEMPWVKVTPNVSDAAWDGVLNTLSYGQYQNYLRREKHFYAFPIWVAITLGWLTEDDIPVDPRPAPLKFTKEEMEWAKRHRPAGPFVALIHHAGHPPRDWHNDRWQRVVQWLTERGMPVVAFGTKSPGFRMPGFTDLTGQTTVRQAAYLASKARCAVGVDTGMFHLLPMLDVPCLVLSGPSRFDTTFSPPAQPIYRNDAGCQQCYNAVSKDWFSEGEHLPIHSRCNWKKTDCMEAISIGRVIDRLAEMLGIPSENEGLLSVCMIVHNEELALSQAIKSVHDHVDEVVIVDTGSTDNTKEIARSFEKVKLFDYDAGTPIESFSAARNFAFSKATSRYVMWLDGGNVASKMDEVVKALQDGNNDLVRLFTHHSGSIYRRDRIMLRCFAKFTDRVHETMEGNGLRAVTLDCPITRTWQKKVGREDSIERNIRLLKLMIKEEPKSPRLSRWVYYLAKESAHCGKTDEALALFRTRVTLGGFWEEQALSALQIVHILKNKGQFLDALRAAYDALRYCDGWRDAYYLIAACRCGLKQYAKAIPWLEHAMKIPVSATILWKWEAVYQYLPQLLLSICHYELGNCVEALNWAEAELKGAPATQHKRILARISTLKKKIEDSR